MFTNTGSEEIDILQVKVYNITASADGGHLYSFWVIKFIVRSSKFQ